MKRKHVEMCVVLLIVAMFFVATPDIVSLINPDVNYMGSIAGQQAGPTIFEADVPVRGAYLFADDNIAKWDDNGDGVKEEHRLEAPLIVDLAVNGFKPGELILIYARGENHFVADIDWSQLWSGATGLWGVFSSSDTLLWDRSQEGEVGPLHRVPGAINAKAPDESRPTFNGYPTNIPEDFVVNTNGTSIKIPVGAAYLMLSSVSSKFTDNDGWIKVTIEKDTDEDGLWDSWETKGIDINNDQKIDLTLAGADPLKKDIYVEVDYMDGHRFNAVARDDVAVAFRNCPGTVKNGPIALHIEIDDSDKIPHSQTIKWSDFENLKSQFFGTSTQRTGSNSEFVMLAKKYAYHYCLFAHNYQKWNGANWIDTTSGGLGEYFGNDFMVSLGSWTNGVGTIDEQASTFMHELGHNLGLHHGGDDEINYKPNYMSIMNYLFEDNRAALPNRPLTFSSKKMPDLNEASLDEAKGLGGANWDWSARSHDTSNPDPKYKYAPLAFETALQVDWDDSGNFTAFAQANINHYPRYKYNSSASDVLHGYDDWSNLFFYFAKSSNFAASFENVDIDDVEMTWELAQAMREDAKDMELGPTGPVQILNGTIDSNVSDQPSPQEQGTSPIDAIILVIVGTVVVVAAAIGALLVLRKRRRQ